MNAAKKLGLFLSLIAASASASELLVKAQDTCKQVRSAIIRSNRAQWIVAATVPAVIAGGVILAKYKDDILGGVSTMLENVDSGLKCGVITAGSMPIIYAGTRLLITPEAELQAHNAWLEKEKENNTILQQQKEIQSILANQDEQEKKIQLQALVNTHFAGKNSHKEHPIRTAIKACNKLEPELQKGEILQKKIAGIAEEQANDTPTMFVQTFRAALMQLPEYQKTIDSSLLAKQNKLKKQKFTWTSKVATIISALNQPIMLLGMGVVQSIFNLLKWPYTIIQ